jgi:signal transduction histidine kinase
MVVRDVTGLTRGYSHIMVLVAGLSLVVAILLFALFSEILRRVDHDIRRKAEIEHQFLKLSSEHERIIQIEKLSEVGRTIGEIAHQLNNPLVGVINLSQLAERTLDDSERTRGLLAEIRRAGEDCRSFVLRMLEFTKVSRSERHPTALAGVIEDTVTLFRQSNATDRPIVNDLVAEDVVLNLDPVLIRHALFNLLSNADSFSPANSPITIRLYAKRSGESDGWGVSILDEGPGVAKEAIGKVFAPFFSTRPDGTGLGLPVTQHVAILHGGWVSVHNRAEGGACFTLWLPADGGDD